MKSKTCGRCKCDKPLSDFYKDTSRKDGLNNSCEECVREVRKNYYYRNRNNEIEKWKQWREDNPDKIREQKRRYYKKHRDLCDTKTRKWIKNNHFSRCIITARSKAKKYGYHPPICSAEEIEKAFTGYCHISGTHESECEKGLSMDHCHETGKFRGWVRNDINLGMGSFRDNPDLLEAAAAYLRKHQHGSEDQNESTAA